LTLTGLLYAVCCLIAGGLLILDSLTAALVITLPIALALRLAMLRYLIRGARAAKRGARCVGLLHGELGCGAAVCGNPRISDYNS
jgi:hypothetical protein